MNLPSHSSKRWMWFLMISGALFAAGIGVLVVPFDSWISDACRAWDLPGDIEKAINLSEGYAHTSGVAMILLALLLTVDSKRRSAIWLAVLITSVAGVSANLMKSGFIRVRPHTVGKILVQEPGQTGAQAGPGVEIVEPDIWDARQRSFPSGHTATAWGLTIGLSLAFPRSTVVFVLLASLASLQRIVSGAHFPSDVAAGACIAFSAACIVVLLADRYHRAPERNPHEAMSHP